MMLDELGAALTGNSSQPPADPAQAAPAWDDWLNRPGNRTALLQMGLNLMQPPGFGQTAGGQIGQALGAAGEAIDRNEAADLKETQADNKLAVANERLRIAQQNADSNATRATAAETRANGRKIGGLTDAIRYRAQRQDQRDYEKQLNDDAKNIVKQANDILADPNSDVVKQFKGKRVDEVREQLRKTRRPPSASAAEDDASTTAGDDEGTSAAETPPEPGLVKARDGNWYKPDPKNPGKYLKWTS